MALGNRADIRKLIWTNFFGIFSYENMAQPIEDNRNRAAAFASSCGASGFWSWKIDERTCVALAEGDAEKYLFTTSCLYFMDADSGMDKPIRIPYREIDLEYTQVDSGMLLVFLKNRDKCVAVMNECDAQRLHNLFISLAAMDPDPVDEVICNDALHCLPAPAKLSAGKVLLSLSGVYGLNGVEALRVFMHYYKPTADVMSDLFASLSPEGFYIEEDFSQILSDFNEYIYPNWGRITYRLLVQLVEIMTFSYGATRGIRQQEYGLFRKAGAALELNDGWLKNEKNMEVVVHEGESAYDGLIIYRSGEYSDDEKQLGGILTEIAIGGLGALGAWALGSGKPGSVTSAYRKGAAFGQAIGTPLVNSGMTTASQEYQQEQIEKRQRAEKRLSKQYLTVGRAMEMHLSDSRLEFGLENLFAAVKKVDDDRDVNITQNVSEGLKKPLPAIAKSQQFDYSGGKLTFDKDNFNYEGVNIWYTAAILENTVSVNDVLALDNYSAYRGGKIKIVAIGDGEDRRERASAGETVSVCIRANVPVEDIAKGIFVQVAAETPNQA